MSAFPIWNAVIAACIAAAASVIGAVLAVRIQREKLLAEMAFQREKFERELSSYGDKLRAEYAVENSVERALHHLLSLSAVRYRSFPMIRHHIGGFEENQLRQLLVRCGAVRFMAADGTELWALIARVEDDFKFSRWKHKESPLNKVPDNILFPGAFSDKSQF